MEFYKDSRLSKSSVQSEGETRNIKTNSSVELADFQMQTLALGFGHLE